MISIDESTRPDSGVGNGFGSKYCATQAQCDNPWARRQTWARGQWDEEIDRIRHEMLRRPTTSISPGDPCDSVHESEVQISSIYRPQCREHSEGLIYEVVYVARTLAGPAARRSEVRGHYRSVVLMPLVVVDSVSRG